ncbi:MAG: efflux RND transporter periplasmic adaptor subunit [Parvularcula sp.]|jgi:RND family efflux transporter MFP subunit|nr:efflux RND transporter periplasmic adaptor subunit [Parvularcula sp.]
MKVQARLAAPLKALLAISLLSACGSDEPEMPASRVVIVTEVNLASQSAVRSFTGTLRAVDRASLAFELGGVVAEITVELGSTFDKGDVLARLDDTQGRAMLRSAEAALREAQDTFENAEADARRYASLRGSGAVAESRIDQAIVARDAAAQRVQRLRAEADRARDALSDHVITAPYSGTVSARIVEPADVVRAGQPVLTVTGDMAVTEAVASVPERWTPLLTIGAPARVQVAATGRSIEGQIIEVASGAGSTGLVEAVVRLPEGGLTPGASVKVLLVDRSLPDGVILPFGSFRSETDGSATVFVLTEDNLVRARRVDIAAITDGGAIATSGLEAGELIAARGAKRLRDGEQVERATLEGGRYNG